MDICYGDAIELTKAENEHIHSKSCVNGRQQGNNLNWKICMILNQEYILETGSGQTNSSVL